MENDVLPELRRMSRLLALMATRGLAARESAPLLVRAGYTPAQISDLLGVTSNSVHMILKRSRKKGTSKRKKTKSRTARRTR